MKVCTATAYKLIGDGGLAHVRVLNSIRCRGGTSWRTAGIRPKGAEACTWGFEQRKARVENAAIVDGKAVVKPPRW